jgi:hypothetical protein
LTSLEFGPKYITGWYNCSVNKLTSLIFAPKIIDGIFDCSANKIKSLKGLPKGIKRSIDCRYNNLKSLDFIPNDFDGMIKCSYNDWIKPIPYTVIKKYKIELTDLYTKEQKEKFGSYEYQKEYLTNSPEKYKDLEPIGYDHQIREEFDWLFNAIDMGLM